MTDFNKAKFIVGSRLIDRTIVYYICFGYVAAFDKKNMLTKAGINSMVYAWDSRVNLFHREDI